jgi:hypothetical protein
MGDSTTHPRPATVRDLIYFSEPKLWQTWPFLPVIRHKPDGELECGLLYDCWTVSRQAGYSSTVFLSNFFELPPNEDDFLKLPKEIFDNAEEIAAAGWRLD